MHRKTYTKLALGGTFDHFHQGHQAFLDFSASLAEQLIIGLTAQHLSLGKNKATEIESFHLRKKSVLHYCKLHHYQGEIVELTDLYGPTLEDKSLQALAVTEATLNGAKQINQMRQKLQLRPLPVHVCPLVLDESGIPINSTRIRLGEINRQGQVYALLFDAPKTLNIFQREFFQKLHGEIISQPTPTNQLKIVVGDSSTAQFQENNWLYDIAIFDGKEQRQPSSKIAIQAATQQVINPAGVIMPELATTILESMAHPPQTLYVDGEEDLAAVVSILLAPLGTQVYYGQPHTGLVETIVTESLKEAFYQQLTS